MASKQRGPKFVTQMNCPNLRARCIDATCIRLIK